MFQCNYDLKFLNLEGLPLFYRNILTVWQILHSKVPLSVNEIKEEILWNNRFIKIGGKTVFYKAWVSKGILRIKDILNAHDNFLSFQELKDTFHIRGTFLDYGGLLAAIPKDWKNAIVHGNQEHTNEPKVTQLTVGNVSSKYARLMFSEKSFCPPLTVYLARTKFETLELEVFIVLLDNKIQCEREIAITKGNVKKYRNKWTTLCISD